MVGDLSSACAYRLLARPIGPAPALIGVRLFHAMPCSNIFPIWALGLYRTEVLQHK